MPALDAFNTDAFNVFSLTTAINKSPYSPKKIGALNLFGTEGVTTTSVGIEEKHGTLSLVPTAARGTMPEYETSEKRKIKRFDVPHIPKNDAIMADDVQNVRAFGSESATEVFASKVNDKIVDLREDFEQTIEYHRAGAIKGQLMDADGTTTLYDYFTEFSITAKTVQISESTINSPKLIANEVRRHIRKALGADVMSGVYILMGEAFADKFTTHSGVKEAYDRWQDGAYLRDTTATNEGAFRLFRCMWDEYTGDISSTRSFIDWYNGSSYDTEVAYAFPVGTRNVFKRFNAPGTFEEVVNTPGRDFYLKQERMKFDVGRELHAQANPLHMCCRPAVLVRITFTT